MNDILPFSAIVYALHSGFQGPQRLGHRHSLDDGQLPEPQLQHGQGNGGGTRSRVEDARGRRRHQELQGDHRRSISQAAKGEKREKCNFTREKDRSLPSRIFSPHPLKPLPAAISCPRRRDQAERISRRRWTSCSRDSGSRGASSSWSKPAISTVRRIKSILYS